MIAKIKFSGTVANPRIKNLTTSKMIGVNRMFSKGEQLEFSTVPGGKHMTLTAAGTTSNLIKYRDYRTA